MFGLIMGAVALGAAVIGGITSAVATSKQSKALEEQARANQAQVLKETEETVGDIRLEGGQFASMQKAMIGASGVVYEIRFSSRDDYGYSAEDRKGYIKSKTGRGI